MIGYPLLPHCNTQQYGKYTRFDKKISDLIFLLRQSAAAH